MTTTENTAQTVTESTENEVDPDAPSSVTTRNRHQTGVPVGEETKADTTDDGPAENRHQTVLPAD